MILAVKVLPKSQTQGFAGYLSDGTLKIRLKSVPEKGKANEELIEFLSEALKVNRSKIVILSGHTSHKKRVELPENIILPTPITLSHES